MKYRNTSELWADGAVVLVGFAFFAAAALGWVLNVVKFAGALGEPLTGLELFRAIGIIAVPVGCILGWL